MERKETSVLQLQRNESCHQPVSSGGSCEPPARSPTGSQALIQPVSPWAPLTFPALVCVCWLSQSLWWSAKHTLKGDTICLLQLSAKACPASTWTLPCQCTVPSSACPSLVYAHSLYTRAWGQCGAGWPSHCISSITDAGYGSVGPGTQLRGHGSLFPDTCLAREVMAGW